ncbi:MAG TPA: hypothetical protein VJ723_03590 [Candidatus Angelobacter sp.]|nr:hypothetical protein [Candidatus Angelobacter sp.]
MKHLTPEQIVLHFYGDAEDSGQVSRHLTACAECRAEFGRVSALLSQIKPLEVPEPHESFEQKTWLNVRDRLPESRKSLFGRLLSPPRWALAGLMAIIVAVAFLAGRYWPRHIEPGNPKSTETAANIQRGLRLEVGDHLERSQILLIEIMHAEPGDHVALSNEQARAQELLDSNRLYRESALKTGDPAVSDTLDDLERVLAEIANGPSDLTAKDLERLRRQIQSQGLLFKIHVIESKEKRQTPYSEYHGSQRL